MAQQDATEQVKEVLRQVIKYRFWISVTIAALFAVIAYVMGSAPVKAKAIQETKIIKDAEGAVKKYASPSVPTDAYRPIVEEKTQIVTKDVNKAWKELYDRQAPLLTWPATANRFSAWGRKWPESEDATRVQLAFVDYTYAYPGYVDMVYKTFHPFDYETGEGVVAAPSKEALLRPVMFSDTEKPDLGKVWSAQERLWIQHTVLDVIAHVNKNAKNWDSAIVKEIQALEVGNPMAQDQRSLANAEELKKADEILAPGQAAAATAEAADGGAGMGGGAAGRMRESMMGGMRGGMGAMGGMAGGGSAAGAGAKYDDTIYYITPSNDKGQYKILPILVTVLIDQDRVQDFLVELENSPMSIQVMDFELARPTARVTKPEKGSPPAGGGMMGMMGGMGMMRGMMGAGQSGYGGMMGQMRMQMGQPGGMGSMMGMMGGMNPARTERKGTDIRNQNAKAEREKTNKEIEEKKGPAVFDAYFNVVEVTIYGRARFFLAPPADAMTEPSLGETPAVATTPAATGNAAGPGEKPGAPQPADAPANGPDASKASAGAPPDGNAAAKADTEKPAAKADAEKPATKAAKPDGDGAKPKS